MRNYIALKITEKATLSQRINNLVEVAGKHRLENISFQGPSIIYKGFYYDKFFILKNTGQEYELINSNDDENKEIHQLIEFVNDNFILSKYWKANGNFIDKH